MRKRTKVQIVVFFFLKKRPKRGKGERTLQEVRYFGFRERERECNFSLKYRAIRPSAVFGTRRKTALRGEGFVWVLDLKSLLKLREVGVSPYLSFIPSFKYFANV